MRSIISTIAVLGLVAVASADYLADFGTAVGELNVGGCLAFQDDPTDTTTTCYASCDSSASAIAAIFDVTTYTDSTFNTAEFLDFAQTGAIYILNQMEDCKLTPFIYALDNRFSDLTFLMGTLANVGTQAGTTIGYYVASLYISDATTAAVFTDLF